MKNPHAVALGRLGGAKGGRARARALTPERRRQIAREAAAARTRSLSAEERRELARRAARARWSNSTPEYAAVRTWLRDMGAPLMRDVAAKRRRPAPEQVVVEGLRLAHMDASVARALPVMLWANKGSLRVSELVRRARKAKEGGTLGFFLDLTSELARSRLFNVAAQDLKHDRPPADVFFFAGAEKTLVGKELAALNTPPVARRWRFLMNMPIDSFETLFRKTFGASPSSGA